jgi:gluconate:H+ symporter, GntP family
MNPIILLIIGMIVVLGGILMLRLHPILALLLGALIVGSFTSDELLRRYAQSRKLSTEQTAALLEQSLGERVAIGFGNTCEKIGLMIVLAAIIGKCLLDSGAAERIVRSISGVFGEGKAPASFVVSSFILAIPIFFDTIFYLMIPLARAMGVRSPRSYALCVTAIVAGGTMAHSLVPPTPGPLFAAGALGVSLGLMIMMGIIIGTACSASGFLYASWLNKRQNIPLRSTAETTLENLKEWLNKDTSQLPSVVNSHLPIALPVILIGGNAILDSIATPTMPGLRSFFRVAGDPVIALFLATIIALLLLAKHYGYRLKELKKPVEESIYSAGTIVLITASGGAFGFILQQTSIGSWLAEHAADYHLAVLPFAFFVTAVIRTAQGSATVAMITAVGILTAFNTPGTLDFHPVYLAIVIGCGSKIFPWMNDSGFWIICKMSGFTERETIRNFSYQLLVMGFTGLVVTMLMAKLFPYPQLW